MGRVAIVTDSAADLPPDVAALAGISVVPLIVSFGPDSYLSGVDMSAGDFWDRVLASDGPFPTTAAAGPGAFREVFERCFADGAEAIVCIDVAGTLSGTIKSAEIARSLLPDHEIHVVDSRSASMATGLLAVVGAEMARAGASAGDIARALDERAADTNLYVALDTLEYLRKGGRITGAQAAIGTILSVKPIVTVVDGKVETADKVRTRSKARERVLELLSARPVERVAILHTVSPDVDEFRDQLLARLPGGVDPAKVILGLVGPSVGAHLGPGCLGGVVLYKR